MDWKTEDVIKWLIEFNLGALESRVVALRLSGRALLTAPEELLISRLHIGEDVKYFMYIFKLPILFYLFLKNKMH